MLVISLRSDSDCNKEATKLTYLTAIKVVSFRLKEFNNEKSTMLSCKSINNENLPRV